MSDEQQQEQAAPAVGVKWGDSISEQRQAKLRVLADQQRDWAAKPEAERGLGCFDNEPLTGADVFWLAAYVLAWPNTEDIWLDLQRASLVELLSLPDLHDLHIEGADLSYAHLEHARLHLAHLERANLFDAHLMWAALVETHLEGAYLGSVNLERAFLQRTFLQGATLGEAHLERANLEGAYLEGAVLIGARLEGANLSWAHLEGANLVRASFDKDSRLGDAVFTGVKLDQVSFDNTNLAVVNWGLVPVLGDEVEAKKATNIEGKLKLPTNHLNDFKAAVRANRVLAVSLRAQGLNDDADHFAYRAQVLQRQVLRRQRHWLRFSGSMLLYLVSGYGYRPLRSFITYAVVNGVFATTYALLAQFGLTQERFLSWDSPLVLSVTSFHGRVFFAGGLQLTDWVARVGAIEAVVGLLIEIVFIATFTNRFFAR